MTVHTTAAARPFLQVRHQRIIVSSLASALVVTAQCSLGTTEFEHLAQNPRADQTSEAGSAPRSYTYHVLASELSCPPSWNIIASSTSVLAHTSPLLCGFLQLFIYGQQLDLSILSPVYLIIAGRTMVLLQSYDSPPGLSIESASEAGIGLPRVRRLTDCADGARGF